MIQQTAVRVYKTRPMPPETRKKVERSHAESAGLKERELRCPLCNHYIASLYYDVSGHFKAKCGNCKMVTVYNLGYFRRRHIGAGARISHRRSGPE